MSKFKVVFTQVGFGDISVEQKILDKVDAKIIAAETTSEEDIIAVARDADAIMSITTPITNTIMEQCPRCKIIVRAGIGYDVVDVPAATNNGIIVTNIPSYCIDEVSNLAVSMMLAVQHKLPVAMKNTSQGEWDFNVVKPIRAPRKQIAGILGFGKIGRESARKAAAFGMKLLFCDPYVEGNVAIDGQEAEKVELDELLQRSDVLLLHSPLTDKTKHIINAEAFGKMKKGALLINGYCPTAIVNPEIKSCARAGQVNNPALPHGAFKNRIQIDLEISPDVAVTSGDSVLVHGTGPIGIMAAKFSKLCGNVLPQIRKTCRILESSHCPFLMCRFLLEIFLTQSIKSAHAWSETSSSQ